MDSAVSHRVGLRGACARPGRFAAPFLTALCGLGAWGCGIDAFDAAVSPALRELEGLAFLPAAELDALGGGIQRPYVVERPLVVDRFEVTRAQWRAFLDETKLSPDRVLAEHMDGWRAGTGNWPATMMTRTEAADFAAWRGMRLPTVDEWLLAAAGPSAWAYPWGTTFRESAANTLEFGLGRPTPVGTFESGRTPSACYDLLGNVFEWVDGGQGAFGGSYRSWTVREGRSVFGGDPERDLVFELDPNGRSDHVGLRCVADAADYLWEHAPDWGDDEVARARLILVGERFGRRALSLLSELAARPGAPRSLAHLAAGARR